LRHFTLKFQYLPNRSGFSCRAGRGPLPNRVAHIPKSRLVFHSLRCVLFEGSASRLKL